MALNISNRSIEEKAILASQITGKNKTATVEEALDYFLRHHRPHNDSPNLEAVRLLEEMANLPILDSRSADEILGYDMAGLPQ